MSKELTIGICSWSLDRDDPLRSIQRASELGLGAIQLGFFSRSAVEKATAGAILAAAREKQLSIAGTFLAFEGEDYSSIGRIAASGGYSPGEPFVERLALTQEAADLTAALATPTLAVHAGTVAGDAAMLVHRVRQVADLLAERGLRMLLETGRESAETLLRFVDAVGRGNVGVNFDPANFVIYGTDDPLTAVSKLRGRIELVHLKDALRSPRPGVEYGSAAAFGTGEVNIARVVSKLRATGYRGPLLLEVDSRQSGIEGVRSAADYLRSLLS